MALLAKMGAEFPDLMNALINDKKCHCANCQALKCKMADPNLPVENQFVFFMLSVSDETAPLIWHFIKALEAVEPGSRPPFNEEAGGITYFAWSLAKFKIKSPLVIDAYLGAVVGLGLVDIALTTSKGNPITQYISLSDPGDISLAVIEALAAHGADVRFYRAGVSVLGALAAESRGDLMVALAFKYELNVDQRLSGGRTPLMVLLEVDPASVFRGIISGAPPKLPEGALELARRADLSQADDRQYSLLHYSIPWANVGEFALLDYLILERGMDPAAGATTDLLCGPARLHFDRLVFRAGCPKADRASEARARRGIERLNIPAVAAELLCPICLEYFASPVVDEFGDSFCFDCIHRAMDARMVSPSSNRPYETGQLTYNRTAANILAALAEAAPAEAAPL